MWRLSRRAARSLHLRGTVRGRLGAGDPAETAKLYGLVAATRHWMPGIDTRQLRIDWVDPAVDLDAELRGQIWPAALAWIALTEFIKPRRRRR